MDTWSIVLDSTAAVRLKHRATDRHLEYRMICVSKQRIILFNSVDGTVCFCHSFQHHSIPCHKDPFLSEAFVAQHKKGCSSGSSCLCCHKKRSVNLLALRPCSAPVASNNCIVTAVCFPYFHVEVPFNEITARLQSSLYMVPSQGHAYSPTAHAGMQSHRTKMPAVLPHKQARSPTAQTGPQSHLTNRPAVPPHKQARSPTSQTGPQSHLTNRPAVPPHKHL
jgi:hypothetical protein